MTTPREQEILAALRSAVGSAQTVGELEVGLRAFVAGGRARLAESQLTAIEAAGPRMFARLHAEIAARREAER